MYFAVGFVLFAVGLGIAKIIGPCSVAVGLAEVSIRKETKWDYISLTLIIIGCITMIASILWALSSVLP